MRVARQLSVFLVNQPGRLAQVTTALAREKINIVALTLMDSTEHGVLRIVVEDTDRARKALEKSGCPVTESEVLILELPNRSGAFAAVARRLAEAHLNVNYAYCTAGAPGGKTTAVFRTPFIEKAMKVLDDDREPERTHASQRAAQRK